MLTDGEMTKAGRLYEKLSVVSADLKSKGVHVYAIGVGSRISRLELEEMASNSEHVFTSPSFKDLQSLSSRLRAEFCKGKHWVPHVSHKVLSYVFRQSFLEAASALQGCRGW